jgi:hypothetical protein
MIGVVRGFGVLVSGAAQSNVARSVVGCCASEFWRGQANGSVCGATACQEPS